jgi:SAM-dependent methyltransferase
MEADLQRSGEYWDTHNLADAEDVRYWLAVPAVRAAVNAQLTGDPSTLYITQFLAWQRQGPRARRALSVGCGRGELDRGVVEEGAVDELDGIDVSEASLEAARRLAARAGYSERIHYHRADAARWLSDRWRTYDLVFFHGSLHHVEELETVLEGAAAVLRGGMPGLLYVDEYIGPSRNGWRDEHLEEARALFESVPLPYRRTETVWPPIAVDDPTEMIRSAEIPALIRRFFEIEDYRPYYGNLLAPLIAAIRGRALSEPEVRTVIDRAILREAELAHRDELTPLYAVFVGRPKQ